MFPWSTLKIVLLACVSSIDNFAVGLSYSLAGRPIYLASTFLMSASNALTTLVAMLLGSVVAKVRYFL